MTKSEQQYLSNHLNKLLDNYNPMGIPIAFFVSYSKCNKEDFDNYWQKYCDYLKHYSGGRFINKLKITCEVFNIVINVVFLLQESITLLCV